MNLRVRRVTGCSLSAMLTYVIEGTESLPTMIVSRQMSEWWLSMKVTVDGSRAASKFEFGDEKNSAKPEQVELRSAHMKFSKGFLALEFMAASGIRNHLLSAK
jgi:hypothetical protein